MKSCLLLLVCALAYSQSAPNLEFEVATVRPFGPQGLGAQGKGSPAGARGGPGTSDPERVTYRMSLWDLFLLAYGARADQLAAPDWTITSDFDIIAKVPPGSSKDQVNVMLQNLLVNRFGVKLHHEMRDASAYAMRVDKGGLKIKETEYPDASPNAPSNMPFSLGKDDFPVLPKDAAYQVRVDWVKNDTFRSTFRAFTMKRLAEQVEGALPTPLNYDHGVLMQGVPPRVFDQTGLTKMYDFTLEYQSGVSPDAVGPSVFSALGKLGLRLDKIIVPHDVLVIDHIEKTARED